MSEKKYTDPELIIPKNQRVKPPMSIITCIILDSIGYLSYIGFLYGELFDVIWAPLSALIMYYKFGKRLLPATLIQFFEEGVPFLDFIPTFTLTWLYVRFFDKHAKEDLAAVDKGTIT